MKKIQFMGQKNIISKQLKYYRQQKNITQEDLAARMQVLGVNIDQQMISKIEHNNRFVTDYELVSFCQILDISVPKMLHALYEDSTP